MTVERFYGPLSFEMRPGSRGEYVRHSDYAALEAECERLRGERDRQYDENVNRIAAEGAAILRAEALEARLVEVEKALEPFDRLAKAVFRDGMNKGKEDGHTLWGFDNSNITYGDVRGAQAALARGGKADG
ncbi:hypothetical protein QBK99_25700 [Corticibacterium sp. UT-5YL-CI-8]|nr:hypothetical protein [Tianweitania sp. UT-5YL-CI-8]